MQTHADHLGLDLEIVDAAQHLKNEVALCKRGIAQAAAELVKAGDVLLIDGGQITTYLAGGLSKIV
jgi:DeoR/GlpR family transcriptional regulator of sugar metabolism